MQLFSDPFPKLEMEEVVTRAARLRRWRQSIATQLVPLGNHAKTWWQWCVVQAELTYTTFLNTPVHLREQIMPKSNLPSEWEVLDSWLRPRAMKSLPH